ncbi:Hypothetical protein CM240_3261 [Clostridium bornimense]|uniref:KAP NTPase domain-containing protein n=1 Tax=Clostridium bornimense TaxID=1216932 RepID=W6S0U0_9CLOT|nr:P-loop NTPase fold protein [Clostridium bornimense]CDM70378.1 Hypothetical protein CM240_3261 [Clostridium bornimense]
MDGDILVSFDDDIYNRKIIAEQLTKIIDSQDESLVISIDSDWGTGKTTFIKMWDNMLQTESYNEKFFTFYFNAWEHDYVSDPLLALFSEIQSQIEKNKNKLYQKLDNIKDIIAPLGKHATVAGIKLLTANIFDLSYINLNKSTESALIDLSQKVGETAIKQISESKTIRKEFKDEMHKLQQNSNKKIIFFIDELDRCRPTFAIELLEVIKHLFNIEKYIFVIAIDKEQLSHSVATIYGQGMDSIGYLRRFFDLDYRLPHINIKNYFNDKVFSMLKDFKNIELFGVFLKEYIYLENFSLRDIDKTVYYLKLLLPIIDEFNNDNNYKPVYIIAISYIYSYLITMKIKEPLIYKKLVLGNYNKNHLNNYIKSINIENYKKNINNWHPKQIQKVINPVLKKFLSLNLLRIQNSDINVFSIPYDNSYLIGLTNDNNDDFLSEYTFDLKNLFIDEKKNIISKLEFIDNFQDK